MINTVKNEAAGDEVTIFYVDDDRDDLEVFASIVEDIDGFAIHTLNNGDKAIEAIENPPPTPNILFLDLNMPGKDGFSVLQEIREDKGLKNLPIVIISTSDDEQIISRCYKMGASYYITKANDYNDLRKSIEHALKIDWASFKATDQDFYYKN